MRIKGTTLGSDERIRRRNYLSQLTVSSFDKKELNTMIAAEPLRHARLTYLAKLRLARGSTEVPGMFTLLLTNQQTSKLKHSVVHEHATFLKMQLIIPAWILQQITMTTVNRRTEIN